MFKVKISQLQPKKEFYRFCQFGMHVRVNFIRRLRVKIYFVEVNVYVSV